MTTNTAHEPSKCLACGILTDAPYCPDCTASGQADYDRADRAGDDATARSMDPVTTYGGTHTCTTHPTMTCGACARRNH